MKLLSVICLLFLSSLAYATPNSLGLSLGDPTALTGKYNLGKHLLFGTLSDKHLSVDYSMGELILTQVEDTNFFYGAGVVIHKIGKETSAGPRVFGDFNHNLNHHFELFAKTAFNATIGERFSTDLDISVGARFKF